MDDIEVTSVTVNDVPQNATILDVREEYEWNEGHIEDALHIPATELPARYGEIPFDTDLYVVCRSGGRSLQASTWLNHNGYDAFNVSGGMGAWLDNGKPIVSENGQEPRVR